MASYTQLYGFPSERLPALRPAQNFQTGSEARGSCGAWRSGWVWQEYGLCWRCFELATDYADYADINPLNPWNPRLNPRFRKLRTLNQRAQVTNALHVFDIKDSL